MEVAGTSLEAVDTVQVRDDGALFHLTMERRMNLSYALDVESTELRGGLDIANEHKGEIKDFSQDNGVVDCTIY